MTSKVGEADSRLRLDTLLDLRWCSIAIQTMAILVASVGFNLTFNYRLCLLLTATSAVLNVVLGRSQPKGSHVRISAAATILAFDIALLTALLFLTGGLSNPLVTLYAIPILIAATALPGAITFALSIAALVQSCALIFFHRPFPWFGEQPMDFPILLTTSIWGALAFTIGLCAVFTARISSESQRASDALVAVERVLEKEKHLSQLDGLAAAAAHELGTPLATIALVAKELQNDLPPTELVQEDLALLRSQVERCRLILSKLAVLGQQQDDFLDKISIDHLVSEVTSHQAAVGRSIDYRKAGTGDEPVILKNAAMLHSLTNLIDNAADYARKKISIRATWSTDQVALEIKDDGPGYPAHLIARIGEPYLTPAGTKADMRRNGSSGLGIGLFISKTLLERSGARVIFTNARGAETGAIARIIWPRALVSPSP
ncbi:ActS/PrrB/RegB family redox-sensitive histidine kinase [Bosea massiliensis]|jgi:two-component system sensor histidine kinase RegB|uniref:histidine kinase n=1 Tax=Bosea massiliensis TaxID=151419 RepID=A0ABW0P4D3_9HYPH